MGNGYLRAPLSGQSPDIEHRSFSIWPPKRRGSPYKCRHSSRANATVGRPSVNEQRELLGEAMQYAPDDILVHQTVTIGHDIAKSINNVAYQRDSDLVLLGWRGQRKRVSNYALGSNIDTVVKNAECDVAVLKTGGTTDLPSSTGVKAESTVRSPF